MRYRLTFLLLACAVITGCFGTETTTTVPATTPPAPPTTPNTSGSTTQSLETAELGSTKNVHTLGNTVFAGQFQPDDIATLKEAGITQVISLRKDGELDWNEAEAVTAAGLKHASIAFQAPSELTDEMFQQLRDLLGEEEGKTMMHCGGGNRVGAVWIAHRVLDDGVELEAAIDEAKTIGLKSEPLKERAIEYIKQQQASE